MRHSFAVGLSFLVASGCSGEAAQPGVARVAGDAPPTIVKVTQPLPPEPDRNDGPAQPASGTGTPIPQDAARMEKRAREWLEWNRLTLQGAYDKVGKKDPKWDEKARAAFDFAARIFSQQLDPDLPSGLYTATKAAIDAGCDDPMILYLYARSSTDVNYPELAEYTRRTRAAADAMASSDYPPIRRAFAKLMLIELEAWKENFTPEEREDLERNLDAALDYLPKSVAEDPRNVFWEARWNELVNRVIDIHRRLSGNYKDAYDRVDAKLEHIEGIEALRLLVRGKFMLHWGWEARTTRFAPYVGAERFRTFEGRVAESRTALEEAWKLDPDEPRAAALILDIEKAVGDGDREAMELWFGRAMKADGNDRDACWSKLDWLDPKWHGSAEDLLAFGRACRDTKNTRTGIALLVGDAHWRIACMPGEDQNKYLASPEAWADIRSVYDEYLKHHPLDDVARSKFATFSYLGGHYREAEVQYVALGDRLTQWGEFPFVPLDQLKENRERNASIVLGKEGGITIPGWHFVRGKNDVGEWYVNVPVGASYQKKPGILGAPVTYVWNCSTDGVTYGIRNLKISPDLMKDGPARVLDATRAVIAKERGVQPGSPRDTLLAARHAQEYDMDLPGPESMQLRVKTIVIGMWLYELSVMASKRDVTGDSAREFFDSFAFQPKAK